jgi:siroheme synthase-like protein
MAYFPIFISLEGRQVVVVGGGVIATRRVEKLLPFGAAVTVIAPRVSPRLSSLAEAGEIQYRERAYQPGDCKDAALVLAATDDSAVNTAVCEEARDHHIPVNRCDQKEGCDFYFPGLVQRDDLVVGVTMSGSNHHLAKEITQQIQQLLQEERHQ